MGDRLVMVIYDAESHIVISNATHTRKHDPKPGFLMRMLYTDDNVCLVFIRHTGHEMVYLKPGECLVELNGDEIVNMMCRIERHAERFFLRNYVDLRDILLDHAANAWRVFKADPSPDEIYDTIARWNLEMGVRSPVWNGVD